MLASITPLGERSRGFSWRQTATAFALGAVGAGALGGLALGGAGSLLPDGRWRSIAVLAALLAAVCLDATPLAARLPSTRRQVNEDWMARFRGWVYGAAFGAQLGVAVATVTTTAAIYVAVLGAALSGGAFSGAAIGAGFGITRALSLLPARSARDPQGLAALHRAMARCAPFSRRLVVLAELLAAGLLIVGLA